VNRNLNRKLSRDVNTYVSKYSGKAKQRYRAKPSAIPDFDLAIQDTVKQSGVQSDSDSDLEIIGSADQPTTLSSAVATYSPVRIQVSPKKTRRTPVKKGANQPTPAMTHKDLNTTLKQAISAEMLKRRKDMEVRLKEKGLYTSAEELARKHLDREKEAQSIHEEVERMQAKTLLPNAKNYTDQSGGGDDSDADDSYGSEKEDWEDNSGSDKDQFADSEDDEIEIDHTNVPASPVLARKNRKMAIVSDDESDEEVTSKPTYEAPSSPVQSVQNNDVQKPYVPRQPIRPRALFKKNDFVENEAEEEEDEYMGLGGVDGEDEGPDEYVEDDVVVHANDEELDEAQLRQAYK
jgi:MRC1-like domain